ncbi:MAG: type VI secretion system baseplate subunit TssF [Deltaproteobacteria bacterium]|jgi:type VI secretion system protein ImpG|nr:type VI secretion system baseplate subunit TssF [Deltaproteobacteria bacterium]
MLTDYYQEELSHLRELAAEFSKKYPALAPMLSATGDDPDVERLLEGVAFLAGLNRQLLEERMPNLVQALLRLLFPQALRPAPSRTMMQFQPVEGFLETILLPKGAELDSQPVEGAQARFTTLENLVIVPAKVASVNVTESGVGWTKINILINSQAPTSKWLPDTLSLYFGGDYPEASLRREIILRHLKEVAVGVKGQEKPLQRPFKPGGLPEPSELLDEVSLRRSLSIIEDYFVMPQRFLFLEISGLKDFRGPESVFSIVLTLTNLKKTLPIFRPEHFLLNVCPAVNIFSYPAIPIILDHHRVEYLLRPQDYEEKKLSIYEVATVKSLGRDGRIRNFIPFERLSEMSPGDGSYMLTQKSSPIKGLPEYWISINYGVSETLERETLSVNLQCHNHGITDFIHSGEINRPTDSSPAMATFTNIIPPTRLSPPVDDTLQLWKFISNLHITLARILDVKVFREFLDLYAISWDIDTGRRLVNLKRIESVVDFKLTEEDFLVRGQPIRGYSVTLTVDQGGFASPGDLRLFGDVLDCFLGLFHQINTFSRLRIVELNSKEVREWAPRLGTRRLI